MAKVLRTFEFSGSGRRPKYPWSDWMDGRIWAAEQGVDFDVNVASFRSLLNQTANRHGQKVRTAAADNIVTFQFFDE